MLTLAIVGRPNVGKSTLFNRLAGRRLAIVDDRPGVTRDRRVGFGRLGDLDIGLIDTAGFEDVDDDSLEARMRRQTQRALAEADIILFVLDARQGLTSVDVAFAHELRRGEKPVVLVANKAEGGAGGAGVFEAFELGLGEPVAISAEHGEGLADLYQAVRAAEPRATVLRDDGVVGKDKPVLVAVVGRPNAGKSTLINRLVGEDRFLTGPEPGITRDAVSIDWLWRDRRFRLVDTAGMRRKARVEKGLESLSVRDTLRAITFAEVVLLVMDATHPLETQDLQLADLIEREGRALVFVLSKWDLVDKPGARLKELSADTERMLPQLRGAAVVALSAETGAGLSRLMPAIEAAHTEWRTRLKTGDLNTWLALAVERHPPPAVDGRRPRLKYISQTKAGPPTFILMASRAAQLTDAYRRYLVNSLRQSFELRGTPIRLAVRAGANPYVGKSDDPTKAFQARRRRARSANP